MKQKPDAFKRGDRVELLLYYDFWGNPPPKGTVVGTSTRHVSCKMDRSGKVVRFLPQDLQRAGAARKR
jgi:hypothetical protein